MVDEGVALPTRRQARVWTRMSTAERKQRHDFYFPHLEDQPCPLEAAFTASDDMRALKAAVVVLISLIAAAVTVYVMFPHRSISVPSRRGDTSELSVRTAAVIAGGTSLVAYLLQVRLLLRRQAEPRRIAGSGRACNPWEGLEDDERSRPLAAWRASATNVLWMFGLRGPPRD
ncbi:MAG: hypothetical protein ACYDH6_24480 [Acidimicrobiales bacterium]